MSRPRRRGRATFGGTLLLATALSLTPPAAPAERATAPALAGTVRDSIGNLVAGVEVLLVDRSTGTDPAASVRSGDDGHFAIASLVPGIYRIAAVKEGYLTHVGRVDTGVQRWVDLILHPVPALDDDGRPSPVPDDPTWVLRVPRRSIFRERDPVPVSDAGPTERVAESPLPPVSVQVEQVFAVDAPLPKLDGRAPSELSGSETRVRIASSVGERGNIRVTGRHESLGSTWSENDALASANQEAASLNIDFHYDPSADTSLAIKAFYDEHDYDWALPFAAGAGRGEQGRKAWGYGSAWSKQLDPHSSLAIEMEYTQSSVVLPADTFRLLFDANAAPYRTDPTVLHSVTSHALRAGGAYQNASTPGHQFQVGFQADLMESPLEIPAVAGGDPALHAAAGRGWAVRLNAQDSWAVSRPLTLVYGLGYKRSLSLQDTAFAVPRVGATLGLQRLVVRVMLSYHAVTAWETADPDSARLFAGRTLPGRVRPDQEVGYEAELELPLPNGVRLRGSASFSPVQFDHLAYNTSGVAPIRQPVFLTDGNAAVERSSVALIQDVGDTRTFIELTRGRAEGLLTPATTLDQRVRLLSQGALSYSSAVWGVRILPSGTDLQLEYSKVVERRTPDGRVEADQQLLELRVMQDLLRLDSYGSWRLMLAVRVATLDRKTEQRERSEDGSPALTEAFNQGVSAGLSVTF
jgi:hypothetical protein